MEYFVVGAIVVGFFAASLYLFSHAEILIENDMLRKEKEQAENRNNTLGKELELARRRINYLSVENIDLRDRIIQIKDSYDALVQILEEDRKKAERRD